jgi:hypothetical protein
MKTTATIVAAAAFLAPGAASAFTSGSTGADGAFNPTVNMNITPPPNGIFNYTSVNIPPGVQVNYLRNAANTPIVILATGDVTISGTLNVSGATPPSAGGAGDANPGDDGVPGIGGPGGFDGGRGGLQTPFPASSNTARGGGGLGPGGGGGADLIGNCNGAPSPAFGAGGGFGSAAANATGCGVTLLTGIGGSAYGSPTLLPLIGGSGGGGGGGGTSFNGAGGGGGGGAILIAASGTITITGSLLAVGGNGGATAGNATTGGGGGGGGGGSGGAIRLVATTITGGGTISAGGGAAGVRGNNPGSFPNAGTDGAGGRVRIEAEVYTRTAGTTPGFSFGAPGPLFVNGAPALAISSVAGVPVPATPGGGVDVPLSAATPNPVSVVFTTSGVPVGSTVQLTVTQAYGAKVVATSAPTTGTTASATASVSVNLPAGPSVLQAQTTFTVVAALGDLLRNFAGNERVERITLGATLGGKSTATLITVSGKSYEVPADALRIAAMGG